MKSVRCLADGMDNLQNKTLPPNSERENEESCEAKQRDCSRSTCCRASCSSSSTCHRSSTGTVRSGCRSGSAEIYKVSSIPPPFEYSKSCILSSI